MGRSESAPVVFPIEVEQHLTTYFNQSISTWSWKNWYQVVLTYSPLATKLYINGVLATNGVGIVSYPNQSKRSLYGFSIGSDKDGFQQAGGTFEEFTTYNYALSAQTISNNYFGIIPVIVTQPADGMVSEGTNFCISVSALGMPQLGYQWIHNGVWIPSATNNSLQLTNAQTTDSGNYSVLITNGAGSVMSRTASLTVVAKVTIVSPPLSQTVGVGNDAYFQVSVLGTPPFWYQWYSNAVPIVNATNSALVITNVQLLMAANYSVCVGNNNAIHSATAVLTVQEPMYAPFPTNLLAWWQGNDDASDRNDNGTCPGSITASVGYVTGKVLDAFSFDGTSSYVLDNCSKLDLRASGGSFTVEGWIKPGDLNVRPIFEWSDGTNRGVSLWISNTPGTLCLDLVDVGGTNHILNGPTNLLVTDRFQHIATSYDQGSGVATLYFNGAIIGQQSVGVFVPKTCNQFFIGKDTTSAGTHLFKGAIDELTLYSGALSSDDVFTIYKNSYAGKDLIQWYTRTFFGTNAFSPDVDSDGDGYSNLEEVQNGTNPTVADAPATTGMVYLAAAQSNVINVDFTQLASTSATGVAAAGVQANDYWNTFSPASSVSAFQQGLLLTNATGINSQTVRLWAFSGPYGNIDLPNTLLSDYCMAAWFAYWSQWGMHVDQNVFGLSISYCGFANWGPNFFKTYYNFSSLYDGVSFPGFNQFVLDRISCYSTLPLWVNIFDSGNDWNTNQGGALGMQQDFLSSHCLEAPILEVFQYFGRDILGSVNLNVGFEVPTRPQHLVITGLDPGVYRVYLYGGYSSQTAVNYNHGTSGIWDAHAVKTNVSTIFTEIVASPEYFFTNNLPVWIPYVPVLDIQLNGPLTGMQIIKEQGLLTTTNGTNSIPKVVIVSGKRKNRVSWGAIPGATEYQIWRSTTPGSTGTLIATTPQTEYYDTGLTPGVTYYYIVIAGNDVDTGLPSTVTSGTPFYSQGRTGPDLNSIKPLSLAADPNGYFVIPFMSLLKASDAVDMDGNRITFKITAILNGSVQINGLPWSAAKTDGSAPNDVIDANSIVVWMPNSQVTNSGVSAFRVEAFDGVVVSPGQADVIIVPKPKACLLGWGAGFSGLLGNGLDFAPSDFGVSWMQKVPGTRCPYPTMVKAKGPGNPGMTNVVTVKSSFGNRMALTTDGQLWAWGYNVSGLFGKGVSYPSGSVMDTNSFYTPIAVPVMMCDAASNIVSFSQAVGHMPVDIAMDFSDWNAFVICDDGSLWSWGWGALGFPDRTCDLEGYWDDGATNQARRVTGFKDGSGNELPVTQVVSCGNAALALCGDGSVWWWGQDSVYWLTDIYGNFDTRAEYLSQSSGTNWIPNRVTALDDGPKVVQIAAAGNHYMALRADGTVWEMGYVPRLMYFDPPYGVDPAVCGTSCYYTQTPLQITNFPAGLSAVQIACSENGSIALMNDGNVYWWGIADEQDWRYDHMWMWDSYRTYYYYYNSRDPVRITNLNNVVKIDYADNALFALDTGGRVWAWGQKSDAGLFGENEALLPFFNINPVLISDIYSANDICAGSQGSAFALASINDGRPMGLRAAGMDQKVRLSCRPFAAASAYNIHRTTVSGTNQVVVGTTTGNQFDDTSSAIQNGTTYFYTVTAIVNGTETPPSDEVAVAPISLPTAPNWGTLSNTLPFVTGTCRSIQLQWGPVTNANHYTIYRSQGSTNNFIPIGTGSKTNYADLAVTTGTNYYYYVIAQNSAGDSTPSSISPATQLNSSMCVAAPQNVALFYDTNYPDVVRISWKPVTLAGSRVTSYRIKCYIGKGPSYTPGVYLSRDLDSGLGDYYQDTSTNSYSWNGLPPDPLWFEVAAIVNDEEGISSAPVGPIVPGASPLIPTGVTSIAGNNQIYLTWNDQPSASFYQVFYAGEGTNTFQSLTNGLVESRFWHTNLTNGKTYRYQVRAGGYYYTDGSSTQASYSLLSATVTNSPTPAHTNSIPPAFIASADAYNSMIYVHWESLSNYQFQCFVERKQANLSDTNYITISDTEIGLAYMDTNVVVTNSYTYRVTAFDDYFQKSQAIVSNIAPISTNVISLAAQPGNGYVALSWGTGMPFISYEVRQSNQKGGPYQAIAQKDPSGLSYTDTSVQNGSTYYYQIAAISPYGIEIDSPEVAATPLGTLASLPPSSFGGTVSVQGTNTSVIVLSWNPCPGAVSYKVTDSKGNQIYLGPLTSCTYQVPAGTSYGTPFVFQVVAINSRNLSSPVDTTKVIYQPVESVVSTNANQIVLSVGGHTVTASDSGLVFAGPTNLVLRASVNATDASTGEVYFYDIDSTGSQTTIGHGKGPNAEITWYHVSAGTHIVWAQVVTMPPQPNLGIQNSDGVSYTSYSLNFALTMVPDLASFQTSAVDLQLPAPGFPISLSRSYDSRRTDVSGSLGKGWQANWEQPSLQIASRLDTNWQESGMSQIGTSQFYIGETASHLVTVTLPGGGAVYFSPEIIADQFDCNPVLVGSLGEDAIRLDFQTEPGQGYLGCDFSGSFLSVSASDPSDWSGLPLELELDGHPIVVSGFTYLTPDFTKYVFANRSSNPTNYYLNPTNYYLTQIVDRNGNVQGYSYETNSPYRVLGITNSNGRSVSITYVSGSSSNTSLNTVTGTWVNVYDTVGKTGAAAVRYFVDSSNNLIRVDKLVDRTLANYDSTFYAYGTSGDASNRLTEVYDPRGIRVLANTYGDNNGIPDGRLLSQTDAVGNVTSCGLNSNYTLVASKTVVDVSGAITNESVTVNHDLSGAIANASAIANSTNSYIYDQRGRLTTITDASQNSKTIVYDDFDRPNGQTDELGHNASTTYNDRGLPNNTVDANGNTNFFVYDGKGNLQTSVSSGGSWTDVTYADPITDGSGVHVLVGGLVRSEAQSAPSLPSAIVTTYDYYTGFNTATNFAGELWHVGLSGTGGGTPGDTYYNYDANGNRTIEIKYGTVRGVNSTGLTNYYIYDAQNRVITTANPLGQRSSNSFNGIGKIASSTDAYGRTSTNVYDASGNLIEIQYPDQTVTRTVYDAKNRPICSQDRSMNSDLTTNAATVNYYDSAGRIIRAERRTNVVVTRKSSTRVMMMGSAPKPYDMLIANPGSDLGSVVSFTRTAYDPVGRVQYSVDARGTVIQSVYDAAGRRTNNIVYTSYTITNVSAPIQPTGSAVTTGYEYDANGNMTAMIDALGRRTTYFYDSANRLTTTWYPLVDGDSTQKFRKSSYDGFGRRVREQDEAGVKTQFNYDFRGLLTAVIQDVACTNALVTMYGYDPLGNQISQTDANNHVTSFEYDELGRRTKRTLPGTNNVFETTIYTTVTNGSIICERRITTDFRGMAITNDFDVVGRLAAKTLPMTATQSTTNLYYYTLPAGKLDHVISSGAVSRTNYYTYDPLQRLVKKDVPEGILAYAYTPDSRVASIQAYNRTAVPVNGAIPGNATPDLNVGYAYDTLGRLQYVTNNSISAPNVTTYAYDNVGNLDHFAYPNGVTHTYSYTKQNRLTNLTVTASGSTLAFYTYALSATGLRMNVYGSQVGGASTLRFFYDLDNANFSPQNLPRVGRLTSEDVNGGWLLNYGYDKVGNRTNYNDQQTTQIANFDSRDLIDSDSDRNNVNTNYDANGNTISSGDTYDAENHLIARGSAIQVGYDHDGNRVSKKVNGVSTYYLVDDLNPTGYPQVLAEYASLTSSSPATVTYVYGTTLISQKRQTGVSYYCFDGQGSVRNLTSTSATITDSYDYSAYGIIVASNITTINPYLYTGQQWDPDLGMYYLRARYYKPEIGRFWTMDTYEGSTSDPGSLHKYLYCQANPVNMIDPSGHDGLIGLSISMSIGTSLQAMYNGGVTVAGDAMQATLFGVMAGKSMNDVLTDYLLDETGIQTGIDLYSATKSWITGHGGSADAADAAVFYQEFDFSSLPLLVEDTDYIATDLDSQDPQCFVAGTLVLTSDGLKAVESVKSGDMVWAYDVDKGERTLKPVVGTFVHQRQDRIRLEINDEVVGVTPEHPFFVASRGWVPAANLCEGDELLTFDPEINARVCSAQKLPGAVTVYNFEVKDLHDYFITDDGILVHNAPAGYMHFLTRALGSKLSYGCRILRQAGKLNAIAHTTVHQALNLHLKNWRGGNMMPSRINPGALIRKNFPRNERLRALSEFYRNYNGGQYWQEFKAELKAMVQKGGGGLDPSMFQ